MQEEFHLRLKFSEHAPHNHMGRKNFRDAPLTSKIIDRSLRIGDLLHSVWYYCVFSPSCCKFLVSRLFYFKSDAKLGYVCLLSNEQPCCFLFHPTGPDVDVKRMISCVFYFLRGFPRGIYNTFDHIDTRVVLVKQTPSTC